MKRSDFDLLQEAYVKINENFEHKITNQEKRAISKSFTTHGLDGNGRFGNTSKGVAKLGQALSEVGFEIDMVDAHSIMGDKGHVNLVYRKHLDTVKPFEEHPEVVNSRISFSWELLGKDREGHPTFEILCYPS